MPEATPIVRPTHAEDIPALIALQRRVYAYLPPFTERKFRHQMEVFPQGQLTVELGGRPVGYAGPHTWKENTASGTFDNHNPWT